MGTLYPQGLEMGLHLKTGPLRWSLRALKTPSHPIGLGALGLGGEAETGSARLPRDKDSAAGPVLWGLLSRPNRIIRGRSLGTKIKFGELPIVIRNTDHSVKLDCFVLSK